MLFIIFQAVALFRTAGMFTLRALPVHYDADDSSEYNNYITFCVSSVSFVSLFFTVSVFMYFNNLVLFCVLPF